MAGRAGRSEGWQVSTLPALDQRRRVAAAHAIAAERTDVVCSLRVRD